MSTGALSPRHRNVNAVAAPRPRSRAAGPSGSCVRPGDAPVPSGETGRRGGGSRGGLGDGGGTGPVVPGASARGGRLRLRRGVGRRGRVGNQNTLRNRGGGRDPDGGRERSGGRG